MTTSYEIVLTDIVGDRIDSISQYISCSYARKQNSIGSLELIIPDDVYPISMFVSNNDLLVDRRIEVWRSLEGSIPYLDMDTAWFIRKVRRKLSGDGERTVVIEAVDAIDLLDRRIIPYNEGMELLYADKSQECDDMMKAIMEENYGPTALDPDRDISDWLTIQEDFTLAPSILKSFSRRNILKTFVEIAEASFGYGTPLVFDIVYLPGNKTFEFRTYTGQRGVDRTSSNGYDPLIIGPQYGTMSEIELVYDHSENRNFVYAGGQSIGEIRAVQPVSDDDSIALSPFNRKEIFVNESETDDDQELIDAGYVDLQAYKAKVIVSGTISDVGSIYGRNYKYGDKITIEYYDTQYDVYVDAANVSFSDSGEDVSVSVKSEF